MAKRSLEHAVDPRLDICARDNLRSATRKFDINRKPRSLLLLVAFEERSKHSDINIPSMILFTEYLAGYNRSV